MSAHADMMAACAIDAIMDHFGDTVAYTPLGGTERSIVGDLAPAPLAAEYGTGEAERQAATFVTRNHATTGVDAIVRGSLLVDADSVSWTVTGGTVGPDGLTRLNLERGEPLARHGEEYVDQD